MKIFAISDLHLSTSVNKPMDVFGGNWEGYEEKIFNDWQEKVSDEDVVLLAGDLSWGMKLSEAEADIKKVAQQKGKKIIIKGNHEYWWKSISAVRDILSCNMIALQNDSTRVGDYLICGTRGWVVPEENKTLALEDEKLYLREVARLKLTLDDMQKNRKDGDKVICMMHFPPFNSMRADSEFTRLIEQYKIDKVVYGHLHGNSGRRELVTIKNDITYYLTSCDQINNELVEITF
ncbi:MAG: metallophosphoesterase [Clostridia bacterium]